MTAGDIYPVRDIQEILVQDIINMLHGAYFTHLAIRTTHCYCQKSIIHLLQVLTNPDTTLHTRFHTKWLAAVCLQSPQNHDLQGRMLS